MIDDLFEQDVLMVGGIFFLVCMLLVWVLNFGCMVEACRVSGGYLKIVLDSMGLNFPALVGKIFFTILSIPICLGFAYYYVNK